MPKKNILKEMGQSITGAVSKAIIEIHDERVAAKEIVKSETEAKSTASLGLGGASEKIKKAAEKAAETAEDIVEAVKTVPMTYPSATSKKVRF